MATLVNLTPHILNIIAADGSTVYIPPDGNRIARVGSTSANCRHGQRHQYKPADIRQRLWTCLMPKMTLFIL